METRLKVGTPVIAECVHEDVGEIRGIIIGEAPYDGRNDEIGVMTTTAKIFTCKEKNARVIPDDQLDEETRRLKEQIQRQN